MLRPPAKQLLVARGLDVEFSRDGKREERDDFRGRDVERDESVDRQVVPVVVEQGERVEDCEASEQRWLGGQEVSRLLMQWRGRKKKKENVRGEARRHHSLRIVERV
jgi:hypothetical protein